MNARAARLCCAWLIWSACQTPPAAPEDTLVPAGATPTEIPNVLAAADSALREQLRLSQLGVIPEDAQRSEDVLAALIRWKANGMMAATLPFEAALTRGAPPELEEFALLRLAIAQLNLGCEIATLPAPAHLDESQQGIVGDVLDRRAFAATERAREFLDAAAAIDGRRRALIDRLRAELPREEGVVDEACVSSRTAWQSPDRATLDEVASRGCNDGEGVLCWVWATWGTGADVALTRACDLDSAHACVELGDRKVVLMRPQAASTDASDAEALYAKACGLGNSDGCRKEVAVFVPSRQDAYRDDCGKGDPIACLKLARTLGLADPEHALWWSCTTTQARPDSEAATTGCMDGNAFSCAVRAGGLQVDPRYVIRLADEASADPGKSALACGEGSTEACRAGARAFARAGDWGCAAAMMVESCGRGETATCGFAEVD